MSDIEGISPRTPKTKKPRTYERLIPKGGIEIVRIIGAEEHRIQYLDVNDIPETVRQNLRAMIVTETPDNFIRNPDLWKGASIGRNFRVFAHYGWKSLAILTLTEIFNNIWGYGSGDFYFENYTFPEYRHSHLDRWAAEDLAHLIFKSGTAKNIYSQLVAEKDDKDNFIDQVRVEKNACMPGTKEHPIGKEWENLSVSRFIDAPAGKVAILHYDGQKYNALDLEKVHSDQRRAGIYKFDNVKDYLRALDRHAQRIKEGK